MPRRLLFRMTYFRNLKIYLNDRFIFSKNNAQVQRGYRVSYEDIVARRGTPQFVTPCGSNVNDFVPFYFSPITKMAYSIHMRNVPLRDLDGEVIEPANPEDIAYLVVDPNVLFQSERVCWYTDIACNSAIPPKYCKDPNELENHVSWKLFDDLPLVAQIPEIGYQGVCKWQQDRDEPVEHQQRSKRRMAEFLVKEHLRMDEVLCIVLKNSLHEQAVKTWVSDSGMNIPVLVKPGCYF